MRTAILALAATVSLQAAVGPAILPPERPFDLVERIARMAEDPVVRAGCQARGLDILSLTWEDTGRTKGSALGPNISDLTIQPIGGAQHHRRRDPLLPVIRFPNFSDVTADVRIDDLQVLVGNHRGEALRPISLRSYLQDFRAYQHAPTGSLTGSLLAGRDEAVLTSAQACLLPVPAEGSVRFAPVLFNYQSRLGAPAVLVILATPEGTSAQVVENDPALATGHGWGQRLFHNANGQRAGLLATRFSDLQRPVAAGGPAGSAVADGLSCVLVIQVPLVVAQTREWETAKDCAAACAPAAAPARGMEQAVVQAGPVEGPWLGLHGCSIQRDERFPIRATVQFYQATDAGTVTSTDLDRISQTIHRVYASAQTVGSLVTAGWTGRPTESQAPAWPMPWYDAPCRGYEAATGRTWQDGLARIRARLGADWQPGSAQELRNALKLVE